MKTKRKRIERPFIVATSREQVDVKNGVLIKKEQKNKPQK